MPHAARAPALHQDVLLCCRPGSGTAKSLHYYYTGLMDAMWPICPDCLFIGEGTGATSIAANWGAHCNVAPDSAMA